MTRTWVRVQPKPALEEAIEGNSGSSFRDSLDLFQSTHIPHSGILGLPIPLSAYDLLNGFAAVMVRTYLETAVFR